MKNLPLKEEGPPKRMKQLKTSKEAKQMVMSKTSKTTAPQLYASLLSLRNSCPEPHS